MGLKRRLPPMIWVNATCGVLRCGKDEFDALEGIITGIRVVDKVYNQQKSIHLQVRMEDPQGHAMSQPYVLSGSMIAGGRTTAYGRMLTARLRKLVDLAQGDESWKRRVVNVGAYQGGDSKATCIALRFAGDRETIQGVPLNRDSDEKLQRDLLAMVEDLQAWFGGFDQDPDFDAEGETGHAEEYDHPVSRLGSYTPGDDEGAPWQEPRPRPNPIAQAAAPATEASTPALQAPVPRTVPGRTEPAAAATAPAVVESGARFDEAGNWRPGPATGPAAGAAESPVDLDLSPEPYRAMCAYARFLWPETWEKELEDLVFRITGSQIPDFISSAECEVIMSELKKIAPEPGLPADSATESGAPTSMMQTVVDGAPDHIKLIRNVAKSRGWTEPMVLWLLEEFGYESIESVPAVEANVLTALLRDFKRKDRVVAEMAAAGIATT